MNDSDPPARAKARRVRPAKPGKSEPDLPSQEGRVIIENVSPEIDGGRAAAKCVEGMVFQVEARSVHGWSRGDRRRCAVAGAGAREWRRAPMAFVDNDRWAGEFTPPKLGRYLYSIEAWRDPFASWRRDVQKKVSCGTGRFDGAAGRLLADRGRGSVRRRRSGARRIARATRRRDWRRAIVDFARSRCADADGAAWPAPLPCRIVRPCWNSSSIVAPRVFRPGTNCFRVQHRAIRTGMGHSTT